MVELILCGVAEADEEQLQELALCLAEVVPINGMGTGAV